MRRPPDVLLDEAQKLGDEFFSQFSEENMEREMSDVECEEFYINMKHWLYEHASEELKLYWEYGEWVGDEGQLCDGNGNILLLDPENQWSWIQDWDVNEDGYCVYKGTQTLILNTDGRPIKNPVR